MDTFDRLSFETGLSIDLPDVGADPFKITRQTKLITRHQPLMENHKVTAK